MTTKPEQDKQANTRKLVSPKTSVIIRTRLRALPTGVYDKSIEQAIINTLVKLKTPGIQDETIKQISNQSKTWQKEQGLLLRMK